MQAVIWVGKGVGDFTEEVIFGPDLNDELQLVIRAVDKGAVM